MDRDDVSEDVSEDVNVVSEDADDDRGPSKKVISISMVLTGFGEALSFLGSGPEGGDVL